MSNFASLIAAFICAKCQVDLQWPFTLHNWIVISFCWFARRYTFINFGDTPEFVGPKLGPHFGWTVRFLTPDLSKSRSIEKWIYSCPTVRKFYWLLVETPDKSQGDRVIKKKQSRDFEIPRDLACSCYDWRSVPQMHIVHGKRGVADPTNVVDGLAVLGVFFEVSPGNPQCVVSRTHH